jgi:hypothetical protein
MENKCQTLILPNGQEHHLQWTYTSNHTVVLIYLSEWEDNSKYPKLQLSHTVNEGVSKFPCIKNQPVREGNHLILLHNWLLEVDAPERGIVTVVGDYFDDPLTGYKTRIIKTGDVILKIDFSEGAIKEYYKIQEENEKRKKELWERKELRKKLLERERKKELEREIYKELIEEGLIFNKRRNGENARDPIPQDVANKVWNRDGGCCVKCGSNENLEFDHIIPFSKGGATTYRNLQLLCQDCNRKKSNNIG